ncbi:MAG: lysine--tRNA ligase [Pseudomonadota bacterium]|jgi:lysyl-tRNA synthetase class 2
MTEATTPIPELSEQDLLALRRAKLTALRETGNAYPNDFRRDHLAAGLLQQYQDFSAEQLENQPITAKVAGRMMTRRVMGKAAFAHLQDMSGQMQIYIRRDDLGEETYNHFKHWDIGDIIGAEGRLFKTKTGELSLKVNKLQLLTKSLRPLPEKFHGLTDQEVCYRQRYIDLIMSAETRQTFKLRSAVISWIRKFLEQRDFLEVETPMMQVIPGGATARPFVTHHNALNMPLFLRIAPELYLKRLVVGGFEKVFEINRNFRNEGLSTRHNPEFTMLEFYQAYADYRDLMDMTETMFQGLAKELLGTMQIPYQNETYDFEKPFARLSVVDAILKYNPQVDFQTITTLETARNLAQQLHLKVKSADGIGKLQQEIFEATVETRLKDPTFIMAYPTETSPLARRNDSDPSVTDRFELYIGGREIANGFSELNDPEDQADRFRKQVAEKEAGDDEAMHFDADYICALEYGLPPTAGEGIGIDRLVMLLADKPSIKDVLLFPHLRPKQED